MTADPLAPPNPKEAVSVFGHDRAQREFLAAYRSGRVHHAWLISGPSGIGKATLAWRLVKFMLYAHARPDAVGPECPDSASVLDVPADDPVFRRIVAGTEPTAYDLALGTDPKTGKLQKVISVNDVRQMKEFFSLTSADGMPIHCRGGLNRRHESQRCQRNVEAAGRTSGKMVSSSLSAIPRLRYSRPFAADAAGWSASPCLPAT